MPEKICRTCIYPECERIKGEKNGGVFVCGNYDSFENYGEVIDLDYDGCDDWEAES